MENIYLRKNSSFLNFLLNDLLQTQKNINTHNSRENWKLQTANCQNLGEMCANYEDMISSFKEGALDWATGQLVSV